MKKTQKIIILILLVLVNSCSQDEPTTPTEPKTNKFSTNNHFILFNGSQLDIKGVVYGPTYPSFYPWDIEGNKVNLSEQYKNSILKDLNDIKAMGANSLRLWSPPNYVYQVLKEVGGLYFFQTIWIDSEPHKRGLNFQSPALKEEVRKKIRAHVSNIYSVYTNNNPPLIAYFIGNELSKFDIEATNNAHPEITHYSGEYIQAHNINASEAFIAEMADYMKTYEYENYGNMSMVTYANYTGTHDIIDPFFLDFRSFNVYSWCLEYFTTSLGSSSETYFQGWIEELKNRYSNIPLLISETGLSISPITESECIGYGGITETEQADGILQNISDIKTASLPLAGVCIHEYLDSWWKFGGVDMQETSQPEEWFGLVEFKQDGNWYKTEFRESYNRIKILWK